MCGRAMVQRKCELCNIITELYDTPLGIQFSFTQRAVPLTRPLFLFYSRRNSHLTIIVPGEAYPAFYINASRNKMFTWQIN